MKKWISLFLILALTIGSFPLSATAADATTVTFATEALFLAVGRSTTARATAAPYAANKKGVTYTTNDAGIATVTSKGKVTAVAQGECQLTATSVYDPTVSATLSVRVIIPVTGLEVTAESDAVFVGGTLQLQTTCEPTDASLQTVTYESSSDAVATVSPDGLVSGIKRGKATVTVRSTDGYAKASYTVNVKQAPESVDITPESVAAAMGRKVTLKATVLPTNANDKTVLWASADESIATVSAKGQVSLLGIGQTTVTATCADNPAITATVPVQGMELAQSIAFDSSVYPVLINETAQLYPIVLPATTTDPSVTYQVKNKKIAIVDENGVVTGLKGGKTTVYAYTADGSKKRAAATIQVIVPVTGVRYKYKDLRVGTGSYGTFTAEILPSTASDKAMTWVSSDESIATVTGTTNRFKVKGRRWGRCTVTGTTADGGFTVEVYADIGSLRHAVTISDVSLKNGKPSLVLKNKSNMNINQIRFEMLGYDASLQPVVMSTQGDAYVLQGSYNVPLAEGETTRHGQFTFYRPSDYAGLNVLQLAITGWSTDTGYYDHNGQLQYNYNISEDQWEWVTYPANVTTLAK